MSLTYKRPAGPATISQVDDFEASLEYALPKDYTQFLITVGGGYSASPGYAYPPTWPPGIVLTYVCGVVPDDTCDIRKTRKATGWYIPSCFLHFADDPGGQFFVMDLRPEPEHYGKIYVRDHDSAHNENPFLSAAFFEEYDCDPDEAPLYYFIASSFTEFITMLRTEEEIEREHPSR
jgi:hypothetical protein